MEFRARALTRHALWNGLGLGAPLVLALVAVPVLLNGLGEVRLGVLGLLWMGLNLVGEVGVGRAVTRFAATSRGSGAPEQVRSVIQLGAKVQLGLGLAAAGALALAATPLAWGLPGLDDAVAREAELAFRWLAVGLPAVFLASAYRGGLEALQRFDLLNLIRGTASSANFLLPVLALWMGWGLPGIVALLMLSRGVVTGALIWAVHRTAPAAGGTPISMGALVRFGGWSSVSSVVSPILTYLDRAILAAVAGAAAVGRYTPPWEGIMRISLIPASVVNALFPVFSALSEDPDPRRTRRLAIKGGGLLVILTGIPALVLGWWATPILSAWLGEGFHPEAALALQLLAPGVVMNASAHVPFAVLLGANRPEVPAIFHLIQLPISAAATWFLVSGWGVPGAAMAWTFRATLDAAGLWGFMLWGRASRPASAMDAS